MERNARHRRPLSALLLGLALLCASPSPLAAQQRPASGTSVLLLARLPETVGLQWHPQPALNPARWQSEPPFPAANPDPSQSEPPRPALSLWPSEVRADLVVLASQWHIALGQQVRAEARLEGADAGAVLIALKPAGQNLEILAFGFAPQPLSTRSSIVEAIDPQKGKRTQMDGLLVLRNASADLSVLVVCVTAL